MRRVSIQRLLAAGLIGLPAVAFALPAQAQLQPGDPRKIYPGADQAIRRGPAPNPGFTHGVRVLPGGSYGPCSFYVNGYPCNVPSYYLGFSGPYGYSGYYTGGYSVGVNMGGMGLSYGQVVGNLQSYQYVPPAVSYGPNYQPGYTGPVYDSSNPRADAAPFRSDPSGDSRSGRPADNTNDYYLHRRPSAAKAEPGLSQAVSDIENAFRTANIAPLQKHVDAGRSLTLMSMGRSRQSLAVSDYIAMTQDALQTIKTVRYDLNQLEPGSNGTWIAYGKHVLRVEGGGEKTFVVGFVLKRDGDRWMITEVSADPAS